MTGVIVMRAPPALLDFDSARSDNFNSFLNELTCIT
jgi:hypothetical protein